jgi:ribosomal protein S18 acetylase RimI-like enzyme
MNGAGEHGYQNHTGAIVEERVEGIGACFSGFDVLPLMLSGGRQILTFYGPLRCWKIMWKGLRMEQILGPPKGALHYITHLGVAPEWRSHGIETQLLLNLLEQGKAAKRDKAGLDVAIYNPRSQELYERLGFVVIRERKSTLSNA